MRYHVMFEIAYSTVWDICIFDKMETQRTEYMLFDSFISFSL